MPRKLSPKKRFERYQAAAEDFFVDSAGNIDIINITMGKLMKKYPQNSIERLATYMWVSAIGEIQAVFYDLLHEKPMPLRSRQRGCYASIRFCMETIADLEYLYLHPKELKKFMTNGDEIGREMEELKKTCASERELDEKINQLLIKGKINGRITERIEQTLPGCLRDYAMLCLYSHPCMEGFRLHSSKDEGTFDLLFHKISFLAFKVLASYHRILFRLNLLNAETDELFDSIVFWSLDCHRCIANIQSGYAREQYRQDHINSFAETVKKWAHESKIGESMEAWCQNCGTGI